MSVGGVHAQVLFLENSFVGTFSAVQKLFLEVRTRVRVVISDGKGKRL